VPLDEAAQLPEQALEVPALAQPGRIVDLDVEEPGNVRVTGRRGRQGRDLPPHQADLRRVRIDQREAGVGPRGLQGQCRAAARGDQQDPLDRPARFGSLEITVRRCYKAPPEEPPEAAAFLEIVDVRPDSPEVLLFSGWMFASSPAVSALEHPVYDVWVLSCKTMSAEAEPDSE